VLDQTEDELLAYDISDEALESAAGARKRAITRFIFVPL
jgi:hypothetical protein